MDAEELENKQEHPSPIPADVTVSGGAETAIPLTDDEKKKWGGNYVYEAHTFIASGDLSFSGGTEMDSVTADYLIVAGGGGAGNSDSIDSGGGGGAGGVLYKTGEALSVMEGKIQITVGPGGAGGGGDGGNSAIGAIVVPGGGGGTNANHVSSSNGTGKNGGSGGGGGSKSGSAYDAGGYGKRRTGTTGEGTDDPPVDDAVMGNDGGNGGSITVTNGGGGGGGAGGPGLSGDDGGTGGDPWVADAWIQTATGTLEFSRGGDGGTRLGTAAAGIAGQNCGDGGSVGTGASVSGRMGHGGVVVIRFLREKTGDL